MNDQQRASQTVMSPEALMPRASAIGARPLLAIRWSSHTTITRRGRHASRRRGIQNATEHGRIHGVSPRGCRACDEGFVGNASTSAGGADVLGAAPWSNPCAARPAGSPGSGCCDEAVRGEPCSGGAARAAGLMRALSSRASVTTGSDIAACCIASYKASCAPPGSWGDGRRGGVPAGAGDWLPASGAGLEGLGAKPAAMSIRSATDGLPMAHLSCGCGIRGTVGTDQLWESTSCHGGKYPIRDARWQHVRPFVNRLIADPDRVGC